jgi:hypothetical protein
MAKPTSLTPDVLSVPSASPAAATAPRSPRAAKSTKLKPEPTVPLQIRLPRGDVKAIKIAKEQSDFKTISDFMLACFHAYMKSGKHA